MSLSLDSGLDNSEDDFSFTAGNPLNVKMAADTDTETETDTEYAVRPQKSLKLPQYVGSIVGALPILCVGTVEGWTSPGIAHLQQSTNSTAGLSDGDASLVVSIMTLGAMAAAVPAGYLADILGRKVFLLLLTLPYVLGWQLIIFAGRNVVLLCVGRFLSGIAYGSSQVVVPFYNEEISDVSVRGTLGCFFDFMISAGILWCYFLSMFLDFFWLTTACSVVPVVFLLMFVWLPESPVYLLHKGRDYEATESLQFFRGAKYLRNYDTAPEIQNIKDYIEKECGSTSVHDFRTRMNYLRECFFRLGPVSNTAKATRITFCFGMIIGLCGINCMIFYSIDIVKRGNSSISPEVCNTVTGVLKITSSLVTIMLVDRVGRRAFLFLSGTGMALSSAALAMHFLFIQHQGYIENFGWVPCVAVAGFIAAYSAGFGPLPWLILAEIIPTGAKEWVGSGFVIINYVLNFTSTMVYTDAVKALGEVPTFGFFSVISILAMLFVNYFVPETKNKTRQDIQREL